MDAYTQGAGADSAQGTQTQTQTAQVYDVGRISARRFAGVRITGDLILRSAMVIFLAVSLYAQLDHTAYVVEHLARKSASGAHAYALAVAVEFSVLLFVLAGHRRISWAFAAATFLTNLSFYWIQLDGNWQSAEGLMAVLMALLLPGVIIGYSHSAVGGKHGAGAAQDDAQTTQTQAQGHADGADDADAQVSAQVDRAYTAQVSADGHTQAQTGAGAGAEAQVDAQTQTQGSAGAQQDAQKRTQKRTQAQVEGAGMTRAQRLRHIEESGAVDPAQVAAQYGISLRTAQVDIKEVREAMTQVNGTAVHA